MCIIGLWKKCILDNFDMQNQGKKNFWIPTLSFWGLSWHAPLNPAWRAGWLVLVRWQLERPMYDFKNSFPLILSIFIEQNIFFPETYNALTISEPDFTVYTAYLCIALPCRSFWPFFHLTIKADHQCWVPYNKTQNCSRPYPSTRG